VYTPGEELLNAFISKEADDSPFFFMVPRNAESSPVNSFGRFKTSFVAFAACEPVFSSDSVNMKSVFG
jgi:hypothetical protein